MTPVDVGKLFDKVFKAWLRADMAHDGPGEHAIVDVTVETIDLGSQVAKGKLLGEALKRRLGDLATALVKARAIPNKCQELVDAIAKTEEAMREAWNLP